MDNIINHRYQVVRSLGKGGMGEAFLAKDIHTPSQRPCVVKYLQPQATDPEVLKVIQERFQREAFTLEDLGKGCAQIPTLHAYFPHEDSYCLVQEWVDGQDIQKTISQQGTLSEAAVLPIFESLLNTLDYVHNKGIIHRDIKPENVMLPQDGGQPVLIDFGAVRELMSKDFSHRTSQQSITIGTPGFMPPEQAAGRPTYSSDLYSLGLTCIYMLTGRSPQELTSDQRTGQIYWRQYAPQVSNDLANLLDQAIAPDQHRRFQTAQDLLRAMRSKGLIKPDQPSSSNPENPLKFPWPQLSADAWFKVITLSGILGGLILLAIALLTRSPSPEPIANPPEIAPSSSVTPTIPIAPPVTPTVAIVPQSPIVPISSYSPSPSPEPPAPEPEPTPEPPAPESPAPEPEPTPELSDESTSQATTAEQVKQWAFPKAECGDSNPPGIFHRVYINRTDQATLNYIRQNYCNDALLREALSVIQVASFRNREAAKVFVQDVIDQDPKINNATISDPIFVSDSATGAE